MAIDLTLAKGRFAGPRGHERRSLGSNLPGACDRRRRKCARAPRVESHRSPLDAERRTGASGDRICATRRASAAAGGAPWRSPLQLREPVSLDWRIRVIDRSSAPIPEVVLHHLTTEGPQEIGRTDVQGEFLATALRAGDSVLAIHGDYVAQSETLTDSPDRVCTIVLEEGGVIRGRVLFKDVAVPGVLVVATPTTLTRIDATVSRRALAGDPEIPAARSRADGTFAIHGLDRSKTYSLLAGGSGYALPYPKVNVDASDPAEAEIQVRPVYGLAIQFAPSDGDRLRACEDLFRVGTGGRSRPSGKLIAFPDSGPTPVLVGIPFEPRDDASRRSHSSLGGVRRGHRCPWALWRVQGVPGLRSRDDHGRPPEASRRAAREAGSLDAAGRRLRHARGGSPRSADRRPQRGRSATTGDRRVPRVPGGVGGGRSSSSSYGAGRYNT